jgi:CubicO group peptidase (beta-lactamase class C family)
MGTLSARLEAALAPALAAAGIPGAVAQVVDADGVLADVALGHPPDARFDIASMTKPLVSIAALQLVADGRLSLDAPIADLLPGLAAPQLITGQPAKTPITLRHLLTHTSGLGADFVQPEIAATRSAPVKPGTMAAITMPLLFEPGTGWAYGASTDWVGLAVAAASGQRLDAYLAAQVLGPLGMHATGYGGNNVPVMARGPHGILAPLPGFSTFHPAMEFIPGGAGLSGTAADYGRFLRLLLRDGELDGARLLPQAMVEELARNQVADLPAGRLTTALPWLLAPYDPAPGQRCGWGLASAVHLEAGPHGRRAGTLAWGGIGNTHFWVDRKAGLAAVLMMQLLPFADPGALAVLAALERAVYGI